MSHLSSNDSISFGQTERKSFFSKMSPRVIIYPIIVLIIVMLMMKNDKLAKKAELEKQQEQQQRQVQKLDPMKPAEFVSPKAPLFPQLVFYYEQSFKEKEMMERLNEKYHKVCAVFAVDVTKNPDSMANVAERKIPYAVLSKPDGTQITTMTLMDYEFYDAMLGTLLQPLATQPAETPAPSN